MEKVTAAVQATTVFLEREATVDKACRLTGEAAAAGRPHRRGPSAADHGGANHAP